MPLDLSSLAKAVRKTRSVISKAEDQGLTDKLEPIIRDAIKSGVIQHFEFTYELCWKFIKRWLKTNSNYAEAENPITRRELFRLAAKSHLISDPQKWFAYGDARNITSHTYNEETSEHVYSLAKEFISHAEELLSRLEASND